MDRLRVLQVSTSDSEGGAANVAWNLFQAYRSRGHGSWLAVGSKGRTDSDILRIPHADFRSVWARAWLSIGKLRANSRLQNWSAWIGQPLRQVRIQRGYEDFDFPGSWHLLDLPSEPPDIIHCHNLHGNYFDLRVLSWLSAQVPVILTIHDEWLLTGHCAYTLGCERWKMECGDCPDLGIYPSVGRDATALNRRRKRFIYARSRLNVSVPCQWLMDKVEESILAAAVAETRVMPYGIDVSVFHPEDKEAARMALKIPLGAEVLLFTANGVRQNMFKDYRTIEAAVAKVNHRPNGKELRLIALGEEAPPERIGECPVRFVKYQYDQQEVARYYHAADLYIHAAKADTFPVAILEALACGIPVVATNVGGISEQVKGCADLGIGLPAVNRYKIDEATGVLVNQADAAAMAQAITTLLNEHRVRRQLAENAASDARTRFNLCSYVDDHLEWYHRLIEDYAAGRRNGGRSASDPIRQ